MSDLPIIYSAHHASHDFGDFTHRCALTLERRVRFSDYGSDETVPRHGKVLRSFYSRGLIDLNRRPTDPDRFREEDFWRPRHCIWNPGAVPTDREREQMQREIYEPYHYRLLSTISAIGRKMAADGIPITKPIVVVAWDNTGHYGMKKHFILSNDGDPNKGYSTNPARNTTCRKEFIEELTNSFASHLTDQGVVNDVCMNVYEDTPNDECGFIARRYSSLVTPGLEELIGRPVETVQLEYDTEITHDSSNLNPDYGAMGKLRAAFEGAITAAYSKLWP